MRRSARTVFVVAILASTLPARAARPILHPPSPPGLPSRLLTIYTDYTDHATTELVDSVTHRLLLRRVYAKPGGQAATATTSAPTAAQRCSNYGSYTYFNSGARNPWRMSEPVHINPSGAPSGMVSDWRNQILQAKYVWELERNNCGLADTIIWHMPTGDDTAAPAPESCGDSDGVNVVGFADLGGWTSDGLVMARTCDWSGDSYIYESDITINDNPGAKWANGAYPGYYDLQSAAVHEFGHMLGLGHVDVNGSSSTSLSVMHPTIFQDDTRNRTLSRGDIDGAIALYPALYGYKLYSARIHNTAGDDQKLEPGRTYLATVDVQNTGYQPWTVGDYNGMALSTAPAGRCSAFVGPDWTSCSEVGLLDTDQTDAEDTPDNTSSVVAQGEIGRFTFHIPVDWSREGTTAREWFRIHAPFVTTSTVPIDVSAGTYAASIVSQSGPGVGGVVVQGVPAGASLEVRNDGSAPWNLGDGRLQLVTDPAGRCSSYAGSDWPSCTVASVVDAPSEGAVLPGQTATFTFTIKTPIDMNQFMLSRAERFDVAVTGRPAPRLGIPSTFVFQMF